MRERLQAYGKASSKPGKGLELIKDLIGASDSLPADLSRKKHYLKQGYGRKPYR